MCPTSKFFNFRQGVITKQLAAAALVCAVAPGSVFATAAYDAGAFVQFTSITPDPGLIVELLIDDSSVTPFVDGVASVDEASSTPEIGATDFDSQIVRVTGEASSPATGASTSDASASNFSSITAINPTDANLELVVDFFYGWDASVLIDDPLLETAGASVAILSKVSMLKSGSVPVWKSSRSMLTSVSLPSRPVWRSVTTSVSAERVRVYCD